MASRTRPNALPGVVAAVLALGLVISGCSAAPTTAEPLLPVSSALPTPTEVSQAPPIPTATQTAPSATTRTPSATSDAVTAAGRQLPALDRLAGLRTTQVAWRGGKKLRVVPGKSAAPGKGRVYRIRVEVETGLNIDGAAFASFVLATLNDKRSWTENGRRRFARTDGAADIRVVLASPQTSAAICSPLRTLGKMSCRQGDLAVVTLYRWAKAIPEYAGNHDGYRRYVINHEVGHTLGHRHEYCAGRGRMAPVMMQQTKGLKGCTPNSWPHP
jgi:hypothetical protein